MRKYLNFSVSLFLSGIVFLWLPTNASALTVGETAPDFTLTDTQGEKVSLSDFAERWVVLEWTNHECPFVRKHYRSSNIPLQQKTSRRADIVWLSIISSAPGKQGYVGADEAEEIAREWDASPHRILIDDSGEVGRMYRAKTTPHIYVVDDRGVLRYQGAIDSVRSADKDELNEAQQYLSMLWAQVATGKEIEPDTTTAYGCGVKY